MAEKVEQFKNDLGNRIMEIMAMLASDPCPLSPEQRANLFSEAEAKQAQLKCLLKMEEALAKADDTEHSSSPNDTSDQQSF